MLPPGTILGRYEIRSHVGSGGMGDVYLAHDTRLGRDVALKILPDAVAADADRMMRFEQEARAASALNHPNIVTIYEIDRHGPTSFIATEFIEGSTLRERIRARPMSAAEALDVAMQIASALAAAHASRIVHRDIKPENIIVRGDGIVKLLDFGLAKPTAGEPHDVVEGEAPTRSLHPRTHAGAVMGTPGYMSPEQARGDQVDGRSDIFSFGVVLYELVAGCLPFEGPSFYETVAAILSEREAPPLRDVARVPTELERIVAKALRKSRDERYQTVKELLLDLQSLRQRLEFERAQGTPAREDHAEPARRGRSRGMPRRLLAAAGGVLLIVAAAIGYAWWRQAHAPRGPAITSLAVLPLKSLDAGENYLGLGIADAAIRRVSQTGKVIVRPTSAVLRYARDETDALTAAKQLGVDSVLEGSLQRSDDRLRVSVNLLRASDGQSLWSDSFDLRMSDIFTLEDTVAQQVAARLRLQLDASEQAQLTKRFTSNPVAYDFYLKGLYNFDQRLRNPGQFMRIAVDYYKQAIDADPNFALAHAQLAYVYAALGVFLEPDNPVWVEGAREEIERAEQLDPQLADTHLARFQLLYSEFEGYQAEAAAREALRANQLDPNVGHAELAYMYAHMGLEEPAERQLARALEIDPTSDNLNQSKLLLYEITSRFDDYAADKTVRHNARMDAWYLIGKGRFGEAQSTIDRWPHGDADEVQQSATQALLFAVKGDFHAAEAQIPMVLAKHPAKDPLYHHDAYDIACVYALEGKSADAVKWLRESAVSGFHLYPRYTRDPLLSRVRESAEFIQFLAEMKAENERFRREFS